MRCQLCGNVEVENDDMCSDCKTEQRITRNFMEHLMHDGHTKHCASRIAYGDGECECALSKEGKRGSK